MARAIVGEGGRNGVVKPATTQWARWVRKATRSSVRASRPQWGPVATPLPLPHGRHRNRCPCGECRFRQGFSTPDEVSFPAKAAWWGDVEGLCGRVGAGLRYRYRNRRWKTVDCWHLVPAAGGTTWVVPRGGAFRTANVERWGWGRVRRRRWGGAIL